MLHYAEPTGSSTIVPLTPVPCSQPQAQTTEPLPARARPQASPDWTTDGDFGCLRYKGKKGEIRIPGVVWMGCDAAFAQGFWRGRALMCQHEDGDWFVLTDQEFTHLIAQELPASLPAVAIAPWKRGFNFRWCMTWYYQPFLDEEAELPEEEQAPASWKWRKGATASVPPYPNALRSCIKQAGYSFREVSRETAIPESTLYSWASGKHVIPHASREHLAHVIGCAAEELAPTRFAVQWESMTPFREKRDR
jgi:hypothetical protein